MANPSILKKRIKQIRQLADHERYAQALQETDELIVQWPGVAPLHVLRAELIQLQDADGPNLSEVENSLEIALALDDRSLEAMLEQAYFQMNVEDNVKGAEKIFAKAGELAKDYLIRILRGHAETLSELGRDEKARDCLMLANMIQSPRPIAPIQAAMADAMQRITDQFSAMPQH